MSSGLLAPRPDLEELRVLYGSGGCVQVGRLLRPDVADELGRVLAEWRRWSLVTRIEGQHRSFDAAGVDQVDPAGRARLMELIAQEARKGFQYAYERFPLYDPEYAAQFEEPVLHGIRELLAGGELIALARAITGEARIDFADGQMTRYRAGHFLTRHDDAAEGKGRVAAYVLGMTRGWSADDGGQLQFVDDEGQVRRVVVPGFNTLTLFKVPQPHLVTAVAPYVPRSRLSITGWMRSGQQQ